MIGSKRYMTPISMSTEIYSRRPARSWLPRLSVALGLVMGLGLLMLAVAPNAEAAEACAGGECDTVAFVDDSGRISLFSEIGPGTGVSSFYYGNPGDISMMGDWNCDGEATPATY